MSWYFIDGSGATIGPVALTVLETKWRSKELNGQNYVWNGTTVANWLRIDDVPNLKSQLAGPAAPAPAPRQPAAPKAKAKPKKKKAGGARGNLLASIRGGNKLKKAPKPEETKAKPKPKGKMSLQEQLAMRLKKPSGGGAKKKTGGPKPKTNTAAKNKSPFPKKSSAFPKKKVTPTKKTNTSSSGGGSCNVNKQALKRKIDSCNEDWILQAIEKLLS